MFRVNKKLGETPIRRPTRHKIHPISPETASGNVLMPRSVLYDLVNPKCSACGKAEMEATGNATEGLFEITEITCQACSNIHHIPNSPSKPVHCHTSKGKGVKPINLGSVTSR